MGEFGRSKDSVNGFVYLYGKPVDQLPVSREARIEMHTAQAKCAKELYDKLYDEKSQLSKDILACNLHVETGRSKYDRLYDKAAKLASRMRDVKEAQEWNELMLRRLQWQSVWHPS